MNINGIYGASNLTAPDKSIENETKEVESSNKNNNISPESVIKPSEAAFTTYKQELDNSIEEKKQKDNKDQTDTEDKKDLNNTANRMTDEDYKDISEEGISLDEYNIERLERMLQRVKTGRQTKEVSIENQKVKIDEKQEAIKNMSVNFGKNKDIIKKLEAANLPITQSNIEKLSTAMEMAGVVSFISDQSKNYLIKNELEPTIENIYKAVYSGNQVNNKMVSDTDWTNLKEQINGVIEDAGLLVDETTTTSAKWLLINNLPITDNTLWAEKDLNQIKDLTKNEILKKCIENMKDGNSPETVSLSFIPKEKVTKFLNTINNISDNDIRTVVKKETDYDPSQINFRKLEAILKQENANEANKDKESSPVNNSDQRISTESVDIKTITVRRQLEEIRLKMTVETGGMLLKKGFNLETDSLSKLIDGLKDVEDRYYKNLLKEGNLEANTENTQALKANLQSVEALKSVPSYVLGSTLDTRKLATVTTLLESGNNLKQALANDTYEALMTKPRADMGDSISKAFRNTNVILNDLGLEVNSANERAVRILGYNQIEITKENIQNVKIYDQQVNYMMKNFHPAVAVEMIRNGMNPIDMPVEELNEQIEQIKGQKGITDEEKYSKYLWKLEKNKSITEEEKKSFIGIYRLLNNVDKTHGAALGAVIKADQTVTMSNLLTAVRTGKSKGVDSVIDDSFGALSELSFSGESITEQISTSYQTKEMKATDNSQSNDENTDYIKALAKDSMENISPEKLQSLGDLDGILNMSLESFQEEMVMQTAESDIEREYYKSKLEELKNLSSLQNEVEDILKEYDIPVTVSNIIAASDYSSRVQNPFTKLNEIFKQRSNNNQIMDNNDYDGANNLQSIGEELVDSMDNRESLQSQYDNMVTNINTILSGYYQDSAITSSDIISLQRISKSMNFMNQMAAKDNYQIPLVTGDEVTNVNVTILKNTGNLGKASIRMDTKQLGNIYLSLSVKKDEVSAFISCDNREGLDKIAANDIKLRDNFMASGLKMKQINYGIGNQIRETSRYKTYKSQENEDNDSEGKEAVQTDTLLRLSKTFILQMKELEEES